MDWNERESAYSYPVEVVMTDEFDKKIKIADEVLEAQREELKKMLEEHPGSVTDDTLKIIIPTIRRIIPSVIANDIVNVQPMFLPKEKYRVGKEEKINGEIWHNITCTDEIRQWVIDTIDDAQYLDGTNDFQNRLTLSPQAMMLFKLKWS